MLLEDNLWFDFYNFPKFVSTFFRPNTIWGPKSIIISEKKEWRKSNLTRQFIYQRGASLLPLILARLTYGSIYLWMVGRSYKLSLQPSKFVCCRPPSLVRDPLSIRGKPDRPTLSHLPIGSLFVAGDLVWFTTDRWSWTVATLARPCQY